MALKLVMVLALSAFAIGGKLSQGPRTGKMPEEPRVRKQPPQRFPLTGSCGGDGNGVNDGSRQFGYKTSRRIVGGTEAPLGAWPWHALLLITTPPQVMFQCGGTLVDSNWVVTAAHCVENAQNVTISLGVHYMSQQSPTEQQFYATRVISHPSYNADASSTHDMALLKLDRSIELNYAVNLACLPGSSGSVAVGTDCWVTGFGATYLRSDALLQVSVPIVSHSTCQHGYPQETIDDTMICAGYPEGGKDSCVGDSGGPMVCEANGKFFLEGVVSWGYGCARPRRYGVYARVRHFRQWMDRVMSQY